MILKIISKNDFIKNSLGSYKSSLKNKWLDEICNYILKIEYRIYDKYYDSRRLSC